MKRIICLLITFALVFCLSACGSKTPCESADTTQHEKNEATPTGDIADTVLLGNIYTGLETVEALAVKDGKVLFTGSKADVQPFIGENTVLEEYSAIQLIMPGIIDAHTHATQLINASSFLCNLPEGSTAEECVTIINGFVTENPDYEYYVARGWVNSSFENSCPTAELLDVIETDKPIYAISSDGHSYWTNSNLIRLAGITAETQDPDGGLIERNPDGTPNGCFRDTAQALISNALPKSGAEAKKAGILLTQQTYAAYGYTSYLEINANDANETLFYPFIEAYEMLDQENQLIQYVQGGFVVNNDGDAMAAVDKAIELRDSTAGGKFELTNVKVYMDGVVEGGTAYLSEPYVTDTGYYGEARWKTPEDLKKLTEIIVRANRAGMSVHFHAVGDQAISDAVDCIEKAYKQLGDQVVACRNAIVHLQIVNPIDYDRFTSLGIVAVINPWACKYPGFYTETEVMYLGEDRASKEYPVKSFADAGVQLSFGTDYGASFVCEPLDCIHILTTRMTEDEDPTTLLGGEESIGLENTIRMMTRGGAYQMFKEDELGSLETGKAANLILLDQDILSLPTIEIENTAVLRTMIDGNWVYIK